MTDAESRIIKDSRGFWNILSALELAESPKNAKMLEPFLRPVKDCYECGVEVPTLPSRHGKSEDIRTSAPFLRRCLNDLRAVWNLLMLGYTSQAGAVAAAAFENSLIASCVAGSVPRAKKLCNSKSGASPWSVADLCKMFERKLEEQSERSIDISDKAETIPYWQVLYAHYMWLCNLKHPTISSVLHDAFSTSLNGTQYIIMAAPDTRIEDLPNKACILSVTVLRTFEAIESFALAREPDNEKANVIAWQKRFDSIMENLYKAVDPMMEMPLPFDYRGRPLKKK